jgi:predicted alpha/beta-fold hydrolase
MYHAGLTSDLRKYVEGLAGPVVLAGFSLGANVVLKLGGEWSGRVPDSVLGVCAVSVPVDLGACVDELERPANRLYQWKFVDRLKARVRRRHEFDAAFPIEGLERIRTIRQFDDRYVAPFFGFGTAANYYATQSSGPFVDEIRVPAMILQAQDDPMIPFRLFARGWRNPQVEVVATKHGGHLGFIARSGARFWVDEMLMGFAGRVAGVVAR